MAEKSFITGTVFFLLAIALLFLFLNSPEGDPIKNASLFLLLLLGTVGALVFMGGERVSVFYEVKNSKDFYNDAALGVFFGLVAMVIAISILGFIGFVFNLFGSIGLSTLSAFSTVDLFLVNWAFPLAETLILVGATLILAKRLKFVPYPRVFAAVLVMFLFAFFHFADRGQNFYPKDLGGLISFAGETHGLGTPNYHGALPQFVLGGLWIGLALGFKSWVVAGFAHITNNLISTGYLVGFTAPFVIVSLLLLVGIVVLVYKKNRFSEFSTWNFGGITSG